MKLKDVEKDFKSELLDVSNPGEDAEEQRDLNTHYLLTAWKEQLASRRKERSKLATTTSPVGMQAAALAPEGEELE